MFSDYLNDSSLQLLHTLRKQFSDPLPEFIKDSDLQDRPSLEVPGSAFAHPATRQFPCHTKSAAFLSYLYLHGQNGNGVEWTAPTPFEKVAERLDTAVTFWKLGPEVTSLREAITAKSASSKRDLTDDDYALVEQYGSETVKRFPTINAATVTKSAESLHRDRECYPYAWRQKAAAVLLQKAMELGADVSGDALEYLTKAAGVYTLNDLDAAAAVAKRALLVPEESRDVLRKVATAIANGVDRDRLVKLCSLISNVDCAHKLHTLYKDGLPMPEEALFQGATTKYASATAPVTLTTGSSYDLDTLKSAGLAPLTVLGDAYLQEFAANDQGDLDMAKVADILPTIPRDDAQLLDQAYEAAGVAPMQKEARYSRQAFSRENIANTFGIGQMCDEDFKIGFRVPHAQSVQAGIDKKEAAQTVTA